MKIFKTAVVTSLLCLGMSITSFAVPNNGEKIGEFTTVYGESDAPLVISPYGDVSNALNVWFQRDDGSYPTNQYIYDDVLKDYYYVDCNGYVVTGAFLDHDGNLKYAYSYSTMADLLKVTEYSELDRFRYLDRATGSVESKPTSIHDKTVLDTKYCMFYGKSNSYYKDDSVKFFKGKYSSGVFLTILENGKLSPYYMDVSTVKIRSMIE